MKAMLCTALLVLIGLANVGCSTEPDSESGKMNLISESTNALTRLEAEDPGLSDFLKRSHGYAIFPSVAKGGMGFGGAYGKGTVYSKGELVGFADVSQATVGFQLGGQEYIELIAFERDYELTEFEENNYDFAAQASAVAVTAGASADAKYSNGVAVFTLPKGGLMFEASIGGQRFTFLPK